MAAATAASAAFLAIIFVLPATSSSASLADLVKADPDATTVDRLSQYDASRGVYYTGDSANVSRLIESLMRGYDKRLRPNYKGAPVEVGITMYVSSVSSISEINMDFTLDFYFRQHWHDERLAFSPDGSPEDELCISNEMLDKIWWPDTFFANAKSARFHTATTKNAFLRIKPSGWITQSLRLTVTAMCPMDLRLFPMDSQVCPLEIESYAYSVKHISYRWKEGERKSLNIDKSMQLPQFVIRGYKVDTKLEVLSTGNYSRLACQLLFVRSIGYYLIQIYVPSSLIVVISWVSFWLDRNATPARVALGIMTVLTLTTLISNTSASLPKISYLKSIDVYLVTCFVMVFAALLEYAAVSFIGNRKWKPKQPPRQSTTGYLALSSRKAGEKRCNASRTPDSIVDDNDRSDPTMRISSGSEVLLVGKSNPVVQDIELVASAKKSPQDRDQQPATKSTSLECGRGPPKYSTFSSSSSQGKSPTSRTPTSTVEPAKPPPTPVQPNMNIRTANAIDKYSRVIFPVIFVVFTVTYWVVYVNKANRDTLEGFIPV